MAIVVSGVDLGVFRRPRNAPNGGAWPRTRFAHGPRATVGLRGRGLFTLTLLDAGLRLECGLSPSCAACARKTPSKSRFCEIKKPRPKEAICLTWLPDYLVQMRQRTMMRAGNDSVLPFPGIRRIRSGRRRSPRPADPARLVGTAGGRPSSRWVFVAGLLLIPALFAGMPNFTGNLEDILASLLPEFWSVERVVSAKFTLAAGLLVIGILPYWLIVGELQSSKLARNEAVLKALNSN